jgi:hypothetical protein
MPVNSDRFFSTESSLFPEILFNARYESKIAPKTSDNIQMWDGVFFSATENI